MGATLISSNKVTIDALADINLPDKTSSYVPVSHVDFINNTKDIANRVLDKHRLHSEQFGIARDGKQMFGTLTYKEDFHDGDQELGYETGSDQAQGTAFQILDLSEVGNQNDECVSGYLWLFNPSSTTFVKHFIAQSVINAADDVIHVGHVSGYFNTTSAIDEIQFKMSSGDTDAGTFKLYGIKDS